MLRKDIKKPLPASLNPQEAARFNAMAQEWRNPNGAFKVVHAFNAARLGWLFPTLGSVTHKTVLDIGCATGLVSEAFARHGAKVMGLDVAERNITLAKLCATQANLPITYRLATPEELAAESPSAHIVLALEVVEHVADLSSFLNAIFRCAAPDGTVVIATLNRTWRSYLVGILMAEQILRWLPKGTHSWHSFVTPAELDSAAAAHGFQRAAQTGLTFNSLRWRWVTTRSLAVNYMLVYRKPAS